jgi:hypothetical protein
MATLYPTSLDSFTNPTPVSDTNTVSHAGQHQNHNDAITALETKVGITGSAVTTTLDYKTSEVTGGDKAVGKTATQVMTNKTLSTATKILLGSDATGDTYYNGGSGTLTRLPIGSTGQILTVAGGLPSWASFSASNTNYAADSGAANAYVVALSPALSAYAAGVLVQFKAANANTTVSTVNVNGLGVKTIKKLGGATDLVSGDIAAGMIVELEYDGTNFVMLNPVANAPLSPTGDGSGLTNLPQGKLNLVTTDVTFSSSTAENTLLSYSLAGGTLSTANAVRVTIHISALGTFNTATSTFRFKYGATTLVTKVLGGTATSSFSGKVEFILAGAGTTNSQNGSVALNLGTDGYLGSSTIPQYFASSIQGTSAIDSTTAQTLAVTYQASASSASDNITASLILTEIIR